MSFCGREEWKCNLKKVHIVAFNVDYENILKNPCVHLWRSIVKKKKLENPRVCLWRLCKKIFEKCTIVAQFFYNSIAAGLMFI